MGSKAKAAMGTILGIVGLAPATGGIDAASISDPGAGYAEDDILTVTQTGGAGGKFKVTEVGPSGEILELTREAVGYGYAVATGLATTVRPTGGTGCEIDITSLLALIAEISDINGPSPKATQITVTNQDSPANADGVVSEEFINSVVDPGEIDISANFVDDVGQARLRSDIGGARRTYQIVYPGGVGTLTCDGLVTEYGQDAKAKDKLNFTAKIKVTGLPTFGAVLAVAP